MSQYMKLSYEKLSLLYVYVVSHWVGKVGFLGGGSSFAVGSASSAEEEPEVYTGNVEVLALGWSESWRGAEGVEAENTAAIVC